jgi:hypothetical protein
MVSATSLLTALTGLFATHSSSISRQRPVGGEQVRVFGGPAAFDGNQGVEELP